MAFAATNRVMAWLLDPSEPSIRYLASRDLLEPRPSSRRLHRLRDQVSRGGWAADILSRQREATWWARKDTCYWPKMRGTFWQLELLADLGVMREDRRVASAVEHMLRIHLAPDGGFSPFGPPKPSHFCSTGIMVRTLVRMGYGGDERVAAAVRWLVDAQLEDGGWDCHVPSKGTLDAWEALAAFAEIPPARRSSSVADAIDRGAEFFLQRRLLREGAAYPRWRQLHYPWHYWYDVLVGLHTLTALGYGTDSRIGDAFAVLERRRGTDGRWSLDGTNGDLRVESPHRPSKMVTLLALSTLKRARRIR